MGVISILLIHLHPFPSFVLESAPTIFSVLKSRARWQWDSTKTLTVLILAIGLVFALPACTQQKPLTQDQVQAFQKESGQIYAEQETWLELQK